MEQMRRANRLDQPGRAGALEDSEMSTWSGFARVWLGSNEGSSGSSVPGFEKIFGRRLRSALAPADVAVGGGEGMALEVGTSVLVALEERQQGIHVVDAATQGRKIPVVVDADEERPLHRVTINSAAR
jgi:hypothetical protein